MESEDLGEGKYSVTETISHPGSFSLESKGLTS